MITALGPTTMEALAETMPTRRLLSLESVADFVECALQQAMAGSTNGATFVLDGGFSSWRNPLPNKREALS